MGICKCVPLVFGFSATRGSSQINETDNRMYIEMINPFLIPVILISLFLSFIPTVIALIDILKSEFNWNDKIVWILVVFFYNLIGVILYITIGRKQKL